jgi:hypothetical protein
MDLGLSTTGTLKEAIQIRKAATRGIHYPSALKLVRFNSLHQPNPIMWL